MNYLISGATGFVGTHLLNHLRGEGHAVEVISRRPNVGRDWTMESLLPAVLEADVVVHLAGAGVMDAAWSAARKLELERSRVETTALLAQACAEASRQGHTPRLVSASAVGYYGPHAPGEVQEESSPPGTDFLAQLCVKWEAALLVAREAGVPVSVVRIGVVLGQDGGALKRMLLPFKLGLGGPIGDGRQSFPWIHVLDLARLIAFIAQDGARAGIYNAVAPGSVDQRSFARALGRALSRPAFLPAPALALRLILGERSSLLLTGQQAQPSAALAAGFGFEYPLIDDALADLL
jgi:uncharacterized protein (TIGR01777 family)